THIAEINLWKSIGIDIKKEAGPWYKSIGQGMGAALNGLDQQPCLRFQPGANALSLHCVILDDQDPGWSGRPSLFRNQIHQLLAVDRLREIPNGSQRHAMPPLVYDRRHDGRNVCKLRVAA